MENSAAKSHWPFGSYPLTAEESPEAKDTQLARAKLRLDWSFYRMPPVPPQRCSLLIGLQRAHGLLQSWQLGFDLALLPAGS